MYTATKHPGFVYLHFNNKKRLWKDAINCGGKTAMMQKERKEKNQFPLKHIFQGVPRRTMKFRGCEKETKIFKKKDDYLCRNETRFSWKKNKKLIYRQRQWQKVNILRAKFVSLLLRRRYISSPSAVIIKQKWSLNSTTNVTCHAFIVTQQRRGAKKMRSWFIRFVVELLLHNFDINFRSPKRKKFRQSL